MNLKSFLVEKSPAILLGAGIAGFVSAIVVTAKVAPKAQKKLEELPEDATVLKKAKTILPDYIPVIGTAMVATGFILMSARIVNYRFATLGMLYSISENQIEKLQKAIKEEVGEKKAEKIQELALRPEIEVPEDIIDVDDGTTLFFDSFSGRYFRRRNVETIRKAVNDTNELAINTGWASVNDFYYSIGLPAMERGEDIGWSPERVDSDDGLLGIKLSTKLEYDIPIVIISFKVWPKNWSAY